MTDRKRERKKLLGLLTRQHIQDAVVRIITRKGVPGLTMDMVAYEAGVAKGTLYHHFKSKSDLLRATKEKCLSQLLDELFGILDSDLPSDKKLEKMTIRHLSFFDEHMDFFRVLLYERSQAQTRLGRDRSSKYWILVEKIAGVLDQGFHSGVFRRLDSLKVAAMIAEANIAVIGQRLFCDHPDPAEKDARILSGFFLHGISRLPAPAKENK